MHVDTICSHQKAADGTVREYRSHLLRHSFRDEQGRPRKETLANPDGAAGRGTGGGPRGAAGRGSGVSR